MMWPIVRVADLEVDDLIPDEPPLEILDRLQASYFKLHNQSTNLQIDFDAEKRHGDFQSQALMESIDTLIDQVEQTRMQLKVATERRRRVHSTILYWSNIKRAREAPVDAL